MIEEYKLYNLDKYISEIKEIKDQRI